MTVNICFHGIGACAREREDGERKYWMASDEFLRVLDALADVPDVALSFDDGNRSDAEIALPALLDRGLHATFFALAGRLADPASVGIAELQELRSAGMGIGTHGWAHVPWRNLSDADARREIQDARVALTEASGGDIVEAALPLGRYDRATLQRLRTAGYRAVYTSDRFPYSENAWLRARYSVTSIDSASSVRGYARGKTAFSELRNIAASAVKRLR